MSTAPSTAKAALDRCLDWAIANDDFRSIQAWLDAAAQPDPGQALLDTCLLAAIETSNLSCAQWLLQAGANPNAQSKWGEILINTAPSQAMLALLLQHGANMHLAQREVQRLLLGLPREPDSDLLACSEADFQQHRAPRFGVHTAENISSDFHLAMIESGVCAFAAGEHWRFERSFLDAPWQHIWNAQRNGQSLTPLPDGRWLQIGGEHEDSYDPDFFIYNDVIVHTPPHKNRGWRREVYAYPREVFPPTDFHSATLVGNDIIVIGCLGYANKRVPGHTPVYALDTLSLQFRPLPCSGPAPGWIHRHQAVLARPGVIAVSGGEQEGADGESQALQGLWELDLTSLHWARLG